MVAIFVVLTVLLLVLVDAWMESRKAPEAEPLPIARRPSIRTRESTTAEPGLAMMLPGHFLHPSHIDVQLRSLGTVRLALDDLLRRALGPDARVTTEAEGTNVAQGDRLAVVEIDGRQMEIPSPFSGYIQSVNRKAGTREWLCDLWTPNLGTEIRPLMMGETAVEWLRTEIARFRDWITARPAALSMADGGVPVPGAMRHLDQGSWSAFERDFLDQRRPPLGS